jgi:hypothetical protein
MDLTPILEVTIIVIMVIATRFFIPWIKNKTSATQQETLEHLIDVLVQAAQQMYGAFPGAERLVVVKEWLAARGYEVDTVAIEAAVYRMKNAGLFDIKTPVNEDAESIPAPK